MRGRVTKEECRKMQNELANLIMQVGEQAALPLDKEKLHDLEKLLLSSPLGCDGVELYGGEIKRLLGELPAEQRKGINTITDSYINRIGEKIKLWQQLNSREDVRMPIKDLLGKGSKLFQSPMKNADEKMKSQQREKCEKDIFKLENKITEIAVSIEQLEKGMQELKLKAATCTPGGAAYNTIKQQYTRKQSDMQDLLSRQVLTQKALDANYEFRRIADTGANLEELKLLMPPSPEYVDKQIQDIINIRSRMNDDLGRNKEIMDYRNREFQQMDQEGAGLTGNDPFDQEVMEIRDADKKYKEIVGPDESLVEQMRKNAEPPAPEELPKDIKEENL